jgi:hypothetical protein
MLLRSGCQAPRRRHVLIYSQGLGAAAAAAACNAAAAAAAAGDKIPNVLDITFAVSSFLNTITLQEAFLSSSRSSTLPQP